MAGFGKMLKDFVFFNEPKKIETFILKETQDELKKQQGEEQDESGSEEEDETEQEQESSDDEEIKEDDKRKRNRNTFVKPQELSGKEAEKVKDSSKTEKNRKKPDEDKSEINKDISENMRYIKKVYSIPANSDVVIREFKITVKDKSIPAFAIFIDGMTDRKVIDDDILQPLMLLSNLDIKSDEESIAKYIRSHILPHNQLKEAKKYSEVIDDINFGGCAVFVDGIDVVFTADVKGWEHRGVGRPNTELVLRGPQEAFNEILRVNTALIRKTLKDEDLIVENVSIGRRSRTPCSLLYIKDIANDSLVKEVRRRLKGIKVDYLIDSGELEQLIEDKTFLASPQIIATERPDRVSSLLTEGKVAVIVNGSPFALVMPATLSVFLHSPEDIYLRFPYGVFLRYIRIAAIILTLLLPGIYLAITNYHQEMIPTDLLFAISANREKVPFPSVIEILVMELAFELIREAGIRIPGPIGPTLGIIGALILGQAAVAANIVSPILIIVVAVTGIGSFAIPNFALSFAFRLTRFGYIALGGLAGFLGIATGLFLHGLLFTSAKSFGVPFLVPFGPKTAGSGGDALFRAPIWKQEKRPDFLNTKDDRKQPHISRKWAENKLGEDSDDGE